MSQQGERRGHEDDWWGELYDPRRADAGPAAVADSVDDRFDSASRTLAGAEDGTDSDAGGRRPAAGAPWGPRPGGEPGGAAPGSDAVAGGGPQGWRSPDGGEGPGVAPPSPSPAGTPPPPPDPARPWRAATAGFVGEGPPAYEAEPTTLPVADPEGLADLVPDTVLDGARYGTLTLRAASLRGDAARSCGEPRRDALLTARFGTGDSALLLVAVASGVRAVPGAHRAAREMCEWIGKAIGRSRVRLAEDIHTANRGALKSGLHRLTDRGYGRLRARAAERGLDPAEYSASVRCLLLPAHPACRTRVFFGVGGGGLFRLREGAWQDLEPAEREGDTVGGPVLGYGGGSPAPPAGREPSPPGREPSPPGREPSPTAPSTAPDAEPSPARPNATPGPFLFRTSVARPGDTLLLCGAGFAEPLREATGLAGHLAGRWAAAEPPGLAAFLADAQTRVKGYADDRTAAAVWEA
ncbi:protein phosphatase 2C domain-containing protein [Streptomyces sp. NPDC005266]|uniref:protein phosphatase 2C domain-containing protein n=1 Tax=Streptomyces sp. NPDC005266 TaxID=3154877 RepID=UPI0033B3BD60